MAGHSSSTAKLFRKARSVLATSLLLTFASKFWPHYKKFVFSFGHHPLITARDELIKTTNIILKA